MATSLDLINKNMYMQYSPMPSGVSVWVKASLPYAVILSENDGKLYKIDNAQYDVESLLKMGLLNHFVSLRAALLLNTFGLLVLISIRFKVLLIKCLQYFQLH